MVVYPPEYYEDDENEKEPPPFQSGEEGSLPKKLGKWAEPSLPPIGVLPPGGGGGRMPARSSSEAGASSSHETTTSLPANYQVVKRGTPPTVDDSYGAALAARALGPGEVAMEEEESREVGLARMARALGPGEY